MRLLVGTHDERVKERAEVLTDIVARTLLGPFVGLDNAILVGVRRRVTMAQHFDDLIARADILNQAADGLLLLRRARVSLLAVDIQSADVADADGVIVVGG